MAKPVILLAFANERESGNRYLRNLPRELNALKEILERAEEYGLCELEILSNTTLELLVAALRRPRYRGRIAIFHYSGHATSLELLLEQADGSAKGVHAAGLVPLLATQESLQLAFLNGCYSIQQAEALRGHGVPAVIGTVQAVADEVATELSIAFYQALADGLSIDNSWQLATQEATARHGSQQMGSYYQEAERGVALHGVEEGRFPWEILYRDPTGEALHWNLPTAAENPLFGLPPLPDTYLPPNEPYRFLSRYTKEEAAVFFGRGQAIQALYRRLVAPGGAPVILLHGQSGVGKSSLLQAGLFPRLEAGYTLRYLRRDPEKGMLRQLMEALGVPAAEKPLPGEDKEIAKEKIDKDIQQLENTLEQLAGDARQQVEGLIRSYREKQEQIEKGMPPISQDLRQLWLEVEAAGKEPLLIILDQAEEVFTRPNSGLPNELDSFLHQVQAIFSDPAKRPKGKLLLSYRKEYHSDLLKALQRFRILREEFFLDKLGQKGILEIVTGLTTTEPLRQKYNLQVEPALPLEMANNLLADPDSPIAPVLQIILTKMWQQQEGRPERWFRVDDYRQLKEEGILLDDFFQQQMEQIRQWEKEVGREVESSGLALDILNFHTTRLGTAESRSLEQLRMLYQHQQDVLERLIQQFQSCYLLADVDGERTALAHDTLAPIVQKEMRDSDKPGQRALRILETKVIDYIKSPEETIIEEDDLSLVEEGAEGMRVWLPMEIELIEKSRLRRAELEAERRRNRIFRAVAVVLISLFAILATFLWRQSEHRRQQIALDARFTEGRLLAATDPTAGLEAVWETFAQSKGDEEKRKEAYRIYQEQVFYELVRRETAYLNTVAFSADGRYFATATDRDLLIHLFRTEDGALLDSFSAANSPCFALAFGEDNRLYIGSSDRRAYRWDWQKDSTLVFAPPPQMDSLPVQQLAVSPDGRRLLTLQAGGSVRLWDNTNGQYRQEFTPDSPVSALLFSEDPDDGRALAYLGQENGELLIRDLDSGTNLQQLSLGNSRAVRVLAALPEKGLLAVGGDEGHLSLFRWNNSLRRWEESELLAFRHKSRLKSLQFTPDGYFLISGDEDGTAHATDVALGQPYRQLLGHRGAVHALAFATDGNKVMTASADSTVRTWRLPYPYSKRQIKASLFRIEQLAYTPDGQQLIAANSADSILVIDSRSGRLLNNYSLPSSSTFCLSGQGKYLAVGTSEGELVMVEAQTGLPFRSRRVAAASVLFLASKGPYLAAGDSQGNVFVWNWQDPEAMPQKMDEPVPALSGLAFGPEGEALLAASLDSQLFAWPWPSAGQAQIEPFEQSIISLETDGDSPVLALTDTDTAFLWKGFSAPLQRIAAGRAARWAMDGQAILGTKANACELSLRSAQGYPFQTLYHHDHCKLDALASHPEGAAYAAGTFDGFILLWQSNRQPLEARFPE